MFRTEQKQHFFTLIVHFHNLLYILICRLPIDRDYMTLQSKSFCDPFLPVQIVNNETAASKAIFFGGGRWLFHRISIGQQERRREPWSSGYERRLMFQRSWVQILAPYVGWTWHFFTLICCKNYNDNCSKRPKIIEKRCCGFYSIKLLEKKENKRKRGWEYPF